MKIAVTGASGFIGTELLAVLNKRTDVEVIGLTRGGADKADSPRLEWRDTDYTVGSLAEALQGADAVIHLAGVRGTESDPEKFAVNELMTESLLKAMTEAGVKRIVFASTVSVYDNEDLIPWTEDAPLKGRTEYGSSKIRCEELIRKYSDTYGLGYGIARIAQVLGAGERRRGMMNVFLDTAAAKGTLKVMGRSLARKQYIYVKDLSEVLAVLACGPEMAEGDHRNEDLAVKDVINDNITVNVGMPKAYTNLEIAEIVNKVYGNSTPIDYDDSYPETGRAFHMDVSLLRDHLGYMPLDMAEAIADLKG